MKAATVPLQQEGSVAGELARWFDWLRRTWRRPTCPRCGSPDLCPECHTAWRVQDAERRGVVLDD